MRRRLSKQGESRSRMSWGAVTRSERRLLPMETETPLRTKRRSLDGDRPVLSRSVTGATGAVDGAISEHDGSM